jgi:hypothetical protein
MKQLKVVTYLATLPAGKTPESIAKQQDKVNTLRYFIQGVNAVGDQGVIQTDSVWVPGDVAVILGWVHEHGKDAPHLDLRRQILENQKRNECRTIIADSNLFLYKDTNNPGYWLRYSYDGVFPNSGEYCDSDVNSDRWEKIKTQLNVDLRPWRRQGDHILMCLQRDGGWSMGAVNVVDWALKTIIEIRKYTDRSIRIRPHPGDKRARKYCERLIKLCQGRRLLNVHVSQINSTLMQDFENCWSVVNHNSSPAVAAAIEGIPVFVTDPERSQAREVSNLDFNKIENPLMPDRNKWIQRIAQFHWSHNELRSGECWTHMKKWAKK